MITTAAAGRWPSDHAILNLATPGLRHPSVVRWRIFTLPHTVIARRIGSLAAEDVSVLEGAFATVLGR